MGKYLKLVIDPGHGGEQRGCTANGFVESQLTLALAHRLADVFDYCHDSAVTPVLTRGTDRTMALAERAAFSGTEDADIVVALHFDSNPDPKVGDLAAYYLPGDDIARVAAADIEHCAPQELRGHLAQGCTAQAGTWTERAYNVLKGHAGRHPILVECAFLTCGRHISFLASDLALGAIASGIAVGLTPAFRMLEQRRAHAAAKGLD